MISDPRHLKTSDGQYLYLLELGDEPAMPIALDVQQGNLDSVKWNVYEDESAFMFSCNMNSKSYFLKVVETDLQLVEPDGPISDTKGDNGYWFKKHDVGLGEHFGLCTKDLPQLYIRREPNTRVSLTSDAADCLPVTFK